MNEVIKWRNAICSEIGPAEPATRLLLVVLSLHMDANGDSCYPSTRLLLERTNFQSLSTIKRHIDIAVKGGWIEISKRRLPGKRWRRNSYRASFPPVYFQHIEKINGKTIADTAAVSTQPEIGEADTAAGYADTAAGSPKAEADTADPNKVIQRLYPSSSLNRKEKENCSGESPGKTGPGGSPVFPSSAMRKKAVRGRLTAEQIAEQRRILLAEAEKEAGQNAVE